jgi:hypothetical protein
MILLRQKNYSFGITKGFLGYRRASNRLNEGIAAIKSGALESLYQSSNHPKVLRAKAKQRYFRIQRAGTKPYRQAIEDQNKLINGVAKAQTMVSNPGNTVADGIVWSAKNPGAAVGTAINYGGVAAALGAGNPGLAARIQVTPIMPAAAAVDQAAQKAFPWWKKAVTRAGQSAEAVTEPIRGLSMEELQSLGRVLQGTPLPGDSALGGQAISRVGEKGGKLLIRVGEKIFETPRKLLFGTA